MHPVDELPRGDAGRPGRNARGSARTTSPEPMMLDRPNRGAYQFDPVAADPDPWPAEAEQFAKPSLFAPLARVPLKVWIAGGSVVFFLLVFAVVRFSSPEPTNVARQDAAVSKPTAAAPEAATTTPSVEPTDNDRRAIRVIPIHPSTGSPEQKPSVAVVSPRSAPPNEQRPDPPPQTQTSPPAATTPEPPLAAARSRSSRRRQASATTTDRARISVRHG